MGKKLYTRSAISKLAADWGWMAESDQNCVNQFAAPGVWSAADSGSLMRIADALEKLVDLFDPEARKASRERSTKAAEKARKKETRAVVADRNFRRLTPITDSIINKLAPVIGKLSSPLASLVVDAIRHQQRKTAELPVFYFAGFKRMYKCPPETFFDLPLYGIGPVRLARIKDELARMEQVASG